MQLQRTILAWLTASAPLLLALAILSVFFESEAQVVSFFAEYRRDHPILTFCFQLVTDYGNGVFYLIYASLLYKAWRTRDRKLARFVGVYVLLQLLIALITVRFLKIAIGRPRPGVEGLFQPMSTEGGMHSLPSGHTTEITGAALPFALRCKNMLISLSVGSAIGMVAFSRIYLGWHHPSDVFFGWLLGSVTGFAINTFAPKD